MSINENIKKLRIDNKMSQEQLAEAMDVTRQSVSKWETGKANPDTDKLIGLATLFKVPITELTGTKVHQDDPNTVSESKTTSPFWKIAAIVELILIVMISVISVYIIHSNCPGFFRSILSDDPDEYISIDLEHNNIINDGIDGVIKDISSGIELPEYLMQVNDFVLKFTPDGTITSIDTMWYGYDERYCYVDSYLITYDCSKSSYIKVYTGGGTGDAYDSDKNVVPLFDALRVIDIKDTVSNWSQPEYGILYKGIRSWGYNIDGIRYIDTTGQTDLPSDDLSEEISGPTVSIYCPGNNSIIPVRYVLCDDLSKERNIK